MAFRGLSPDVRVCLFCQPADKKGKEMKMEKNSELTAFIDEWKETPEKNREVFLHFREYLSRKEGVRLEFIARPGLTYSLRAVHAAQKKKGLFVMVDG